MKQGLRARDPELEEIRARIRAGEHTGPTGGFAQGYVQTNLVILPEAYAFDFLKFCVRNPKPCPILEVTDAGSPAPPVMAPEADLRTDVPKFRAGDTLKVHVRVVEGTRSRIQLFQGVVIRRSGGSEDSDDD